MGSSEGLQEAAAINCDNLMTLSKGVLDVAPVGHLGAERRAELDRALRYAVDILC